MNKKVEKRLKKMFRPAFGCAQHPKAGRNTQQKRTFCRKRKHGTLSYRESNNAFKIKLALISIINILPEYCLNFFEIRTAMISSQTNVRRFQARRLLSDHCLSDRRFPNQHLFSQTTQCPFLYPSKDLRHTNKFLAINNIPFSLPLSFSHRQDTL